jgi:hypothetical protein
VSEPVNAVSLATSLSTYIPATEKVAVVLKAFALPKDTAPGPLTIDHVVVDDRASTRRERGLRILRKESIVAVTTARTVEHGVLATRRRVCVVDAELFDPPVRLLGVALDSEKTCQRRQVVVGIGIAVVALDDPVDRGSRRQAVATGTRILTDDIGGTAASEDTGDECRGRKLPEAPDRFST